MEHVFHESCIRVDAAVFSNRIVIASGDATRARAGLVY